MIGKGPRKDLTHVVTSTLKAITGISRIHWKVLPTSYMLKGGRATGDVVSGPDLA
jgi:hypothetical protein